LLIKKIKLIFLFSLLSFSLESYGNSNTIRLLYGPGIVVGLLWLKITYNFNNFSHPNLFKLKTDIAKEWPENVADNLVGAKILLKKYAIEYRRFSRVIDEKKLTHLWLVFPGVIESESSRDDELFLSAATVVQYKKHFDTIIQKKYSKKKSYEKPVVLMVAASTFFLTDALIK